MEAVLVKPKSKHRKKSKETPSGGNNYGEYSPVARDEAQSSSTECEIKTDLQSQIVENEQCGSDNNFSTTAVGNDIEVNGVNKIFLNNHQIMSTLQEETVEDFMAKCKENNLLDTKPREIQCINRMKMKYEIKPYTEAQLLSLYSNSELEVMKQFTAEFVEHELKGAHITQHPLYALLCSYLEYLNKITANKAELEQSRKEYEDMQSHLWTINSTVSKVYGQCQDGNTVYATHTYNKAVFHRNSFQSLVKVLKKLRRLSNEKHVYYTYVAEIFKLQIDYYVQTLINNCAKLTQVIETSQVCLRSESTSPHFLPYLNELRTSISVLFCFQRRLVRDAHFKKESREWLNNLVALLLKVADVRDHLFLLNHILRCPPGVGSWASRYIQTPINLEVELESPYASYEINHVVSVLELILMPIEKRDQFLSDLIHSFESENDASLWVLVDSDGEEDDESCGISLRENDLVSFLNQIPLNNLFRSLLFVRHRDGKDYYDDKCLNEHHILRFFAFSTIILKILGTGLLTYTQFRYNQFSKRLCRLIRHIVQYASDQWEFFKKNNCSTDEAMLQRLQIEYDSFFLRCAYHLYISKKTGAWQFLAVIPYNLLSVESLWKMFYFLHLDNISEVMIEGVNSVDYKEKLWNPLVRSQFEDTFNKLDDSESYYLISVFANMALCRDHVDMEFVEAAVYDLLSIGFVSEVTQEKCSKNARILLTHITSKYPTLLSNVLVIVENNLEKIGPYSLYLYEELPLSIWKPNRKDVELIAKLFRRKSITSDDSKLARMIISRLNWDFINNELFIPYEIHRTIALLVAEVVDEEPGYTQWAWQTIFRLRLHITEGGFTNFSDIKDLNHYNILHQGVKEDKLIPNLLSLLMTSLGHMVPLVCSKGLDRLVLLQVNLKYEAILFALNVIVPLFLDCQELLINCDKFQNVIIGLLNADKGYLQLAKNFVNVQNPVLEQFGNMIENHINDSRWYSEDGSPKFIVRLWVNSLMSVPNWNRDFGVMYLMDVIVRASFFFKNASEAITNTLREFMKCSTPQEQSNTISSIFKWVSQSSISQGTLLINSSLSGSPWLAYVTINIEQDEREMNSGLWRELLVQLLNQKGKANIDAAIKKAANIRKVQSFTSGSLSIFRWAQQALDTPKGHPLLPLIWQKFFSLYLYRISLSSNSQKGCVGERFFEGVVNFAFQKRLKKRLQEDIEYYEQKFQQLEGNNQNLVLLYESVVKLFRAYSLWLEETCLQEASVFLPGLPPQYEPRLLASIMQNDHTAWLEYLDYDSIKEQQQNAIKLWKQANYREKKNINQPHPSPGHRGEPEDPKERILQRLQSYDTPKDPPKLLIKQPFIQHFDFNDKIMMLNILEPYFATILSFVRMHNSTNAELKTTDSIYQELIPQLYVSVLCKTKKNVTCRGANRTSLCSGHASIVINSEESCLNERVQHEIDTNRQNFDRVLKKCFQEPPSAYCLASVSLQQAISVLQMKLKDDPSTLELGVELFYHILQLITDDVTNHLPTKKLLADCVEKLGRSHVHGMETETPRLLEKILKEPQLNVYLVPHFSPHNSGTANFLLMYSTICKCAIKNPEIVHDLLSKFDVLFWLKSKDPKLVQRSKFIDTTIETLQCLGYELEAKYSQLHKLLRSNLTSVLNYQFPEHFGEILMCMLKASNGCSESGNVAVLVWLDFLNFFSRPVEIKLELPLRDQIRQYAQQQHLLNHNELLETCTLLTNYFMQERFQYGLYGLYPKARNYVEVFVTFEGMIGHSLIVSTLKMHPGLLGDKLCEMLWPYLRDLFSPWILPYWIQNMKEHMANWIKQLADDRAVLLPWIPSDGPYALKSVQMFFECIMFIIQTLPACGNILSFVWHWYVTNFAHTAVKDHILNVIHSTFIALPWDSFWPSINDVELMFKVVEQYLPQSHVFLGHIFMCVPWRDWMYNLSDHIPAQMKQKVYHYFLFLIVKLANEPNVRTNHVVRARTLLEQAVMFNWNLIETTTYQQIMDWYVMSCDPLVLFNCDPETLDFHIFNFLKTVAYVNSAGYHTKESFEKQLIHIRSYVKLVSVFTSKHKSTVCNKEGAINAVLADQLKRFDQYRSQQELNSVLEIFMEVLNLSAISTVTLKVFEDYISSHSKDGVYLNAIVHCLGSSVVNLNAAAELYELSFHSYFMNDDVSQNRNISWDNIINYVKFCSFRQAEFELMMIKKGTILTLHAYVLQKIGKAIDCKNLISACLNWLDAINICESMESKIPLIWHDILTMSIDYCEIDEPCCGSLLHKFAENLLQRSEEKDSKWGRGLLGAIGILRQTTTTTLRFKFLCRALAGYVLTQLPEMKGSQQIVRKTANAPSVVGQPGGNTECPKVLLKLDFGHTQGKIKQCAELALKEIQNPKNSLHNAPAFLRILLNQFYIKPYLRDIS